MRTLGALAVLGTPAARCLGADQPPPTDFQIACMTLPYAQFPLARALSGIREAGYRYVAWGTKHREDSGETPVMAPDAPPGKAKELGQKCRDLGLEPLLMFSTIYPEDDKAPQVFPARIAQAAAAGIPQVLTFGHSEKDFRKLWIERFREWGRIASAAGVLLVIKQHGGDTGTGDACAQIVREVDSPAVAVNYDAGNVMDYLNLNPLEDIRSCARSFAAFASRTTATSPATKTAGPASARSTTTNCWPTSPPATASCRSAAKTSSPHCCRGRSIRPTSTSWHAGRANISKWLSMGYAQPMFRSDPNSISPNSARKAACATGAATARIAETAGHWQSQWHTSRRSP